MFFYEKSKNNDVAMTTSGDAGAMFATQVTTVAGGTTTGAFATSFGFQYKVPKRTAPTVTIYSEIGTTARVSLYIASNGTFPAFTAVPTAQPLDLSLTTNWNQASNGEKGVQYVLKTSTHFGEFSSSNPDHSGFISFHYEADCRYGVV